MHLNYSVESFNLRFKKPAKTSRNTFREKPHWLIKIWNLNNPNFVGIGEAAPIEFLSPDYREDLGSIIEEKLAHIASGIGIDELDLHNFPSVKFAIESALLDLSYGGRQIYFTSDYLNGKPIPINGLVWMNDLDTMMEEAFEKINQGFTCLKFKVGNHDFDAECRFLEKFRKSNSGNSVEIRLDANGAFLASEALEKLKELSRFHIHSIEQPIKHGLWDDMERLCKDSKMKIALDEELIDIHSFDIAGKMLKQIRPHYLILKPTLLGGLKASDAWISLAVKFEIGWWATSALESNYGLDIISQWVGSKNPTIPQGLGTGMLYENNFQSKSEIVDGNLFYSVS